MKNISAFQGILLAVFGIAGLVGLFVFATYTSNGGGEDTVGPVVIWGTLSEESMRSIFETLQQTRTDLKQVSYVQKDPNTLANELASAIATGVSPDLVLAPQEHLRSLTKFIISIPFDTLPPRAFQDTFIAEGGVLASGDGTGYYGVPFLVDPLVLYSNRGILASAGIARPPSTWEALVGLVPGVAQYASNRQIIRGLIALGTYDNVRNARGILSTLFLQQNVPITSYANGALGSDLGLSFETGNQPGQAVLGFYTQFADPAKISYTWNPSLPDSQQAFLAGDLALYLGYASEARFFTAANPNLNYDVSTVPQPATAELKSTYGLLYSFMISRGSQNTSGAYQTALILAGAPEQAAAAAATGLAPATLEPLSNPPADPVAATAYAEALYARGWVSPQPGDIDSVFSGMIGDVISGRTNLTTALTSAERSLGTLLQR